MARLCGARNQQSINLDSVTTTESTHQLQPNQITKPMTTSEINAAIAEFCGWKPPVIDPNPHWKNMPDAEIRCPYCGCHFCDCRKECETPNYCGDLNAMKDAVKSLPLNRMTDYHAALYDISGGFSNAIEATAAQRAEAFLKTIGKWPQPQPGE